MTDVPQKTESLPTSIMNSVANEYTRDLLVDLGESLVDNFTDSVIKSEIVAKIPVINLILAFSKGVMNYRDRIYVNKILNFLAETSKASGADRTKYRVKLDSSPDESKKVGETVLDILDKITDLQKTVMIGKVFRAYMHEDGVTNDDVLTLSQMIEKAYLSDLIALSIKDGESGNRWNDANLESVGIKKPMRVEDINKAINAAMARMLKQMPVIREGPINDSEEPQVIESGFTDRGTLLKRILQEY